MTGANCRTYWKSRTFRRIFVLCITLIPLFGSVLTTTLYMRSRQNVETRLQLEQEASADRIAARLSSEFEQVADFADQLSMSSWIIKAGSRSDIMFRDLTILRKLEISKDLILFESLLTSAFRIGVRIPHRELTILNNLWCNDASVLHEMRDKLENTDKLNAFLSYIDSTQAFSVVNLHQMLSGSDAVTDQNPKRSAGYDPIGELP